MENKSVNDNDRFKEIKKIAYAIKEHRTLEDQEGVGNKAVASYSVKINENNYTLWLVNNEIKSGIRIAKDFVGNAQILDAQKNTIERTGDNKIFSKNSKMAGLLIMSEQDNFSFKVEENINLVKLYSQADFDPYGKVSDAINLTIRFKKEEALYTYKSLTEIIEQINLRKQQVIELEKLKQALSNEDEISKCLEEQYIVELELKNLYQKKQDFIVEHAKLRYKAILDPYQERIKRSKYYDNEFLLIEGGPGTGKTTTLIQRIKYLIDPVVINEFGSIFSDGLKKNLLNRNSPNWVFFSPNELLYLYLKESMAREGLRATSDTGKVWKKYLTTLMWKYDLSNKKSKKPFVHYRNKKHKNLFASTGDSLIQIKEKFYSALIIKFREEIDKLHLNYNEKTKKLSSEILRFLDRKEIINIENLIEFCISINTNYYDKIKKFKEEYDEVLKRAAARLRNAIQKDDALYFKMQEKFLTEHSLNISIDSEFIFKINKSFGYNRFENWFFSQCKKCLEGRTIIDANISDHEQNLLAKLENLALKVVEIETLDIIKKNKIELRFLSLFIDPLSSFIFDRIPDVYTYIRISRDGIMDLKATDKIFLLDLIKNENNRLHPSEQSFLVGIINSLLKIVFKKSKEQYKLFRHKYKKAYEEVSRMVIAIDEVTDFHIFELFAITSIADKSSCAVTLSGDLMQRVEETGISSWEDIKAVNRELTLQQLKTSYRQSPTLLDLASLIYRKSVNTSFPVTPFLERHTDEPKPIYKISERGDIKIMWIANRILEIYDFYGGEMPSVAIFLPDECKLDDFALELGEIEDLSDVGIEVKACKNGEVLGDGSTVRVFSLKYIKGLEFEAVFFHNLDELLESSMGSQAILRKLYVGLSRATFYIGVTLSNEWSDELLFLKPVFSEEGSWQNQIMFNV